MTPNAIYSLLQQAYAAVAQVHRQDLSGVRHDTTFALGEALGYIAKAKALVGRDIADAATLRERDAPTGP
jgi:hypothetical protein